LKRPLLIANGAFVGFGLVLTITPPDFNQNNLTPTIPIPQNTDKPTTVYYTPKSDPGKPQSFPSKKPSTAPTSSQSIEPTPISTPTPNNPQPTKQAINGTFLGDSVNVSYGDVQVQLIIKDSNIVDVQIVKYPQSNPTSAKLNQLALVTLRQETLAAQSASISGVSGASYTSYGFYKSLVSALNKSGLIY
jgi:uncharacterized protein with FMN-binding domain